MKHLKALVAGLAVTVFATGCYNHTFKVGTGGDMSKSPDYSNMWKSHWFLGLIENNEQDLQKVCPSGNMTIVNKLSFLNQLIGAFTGLVWHPSTVKVWCGTGAPGIGVETTLELSPETMEKLATSPEFAEIIRTEAPELEAKYIAAKAAYEMKVCAVATSSR